MILPSVPLLRSFGPFFPLFLFLLLLMLQPLPGRATELVPELLVLQGARLVDPTTGTTSPPRTVLVADGRIVSLDAARERLPETARVVAARGAFLSPGLIDVHVHLQKEESLEQALAWGVTTLRTMHGSAEVLGWKREIEKGRRPGPALTVASPILHRTAGSSPSFRKVTTEGLGRELVREFHRAGYDLVKLAELDDGPFFAVAEEARALGIPLAGHLPNEELDIRRVLAENVRSVEHLSELWWIHTRQGGEAGGAESRSEHLVDLFAGADVAISTLLFNAAVHDRLAAEGPPFLTPERAERLRRERGEHLVERVRNALDNFASGDWELHPYDSEELGRLLRGLDAAGVRIVPGTDSNDGILTIGAGLHAELELLHRLGLSPARLLRAATLDAATVLGLPDRGRLEVGARADLVLLGSDPLEGPAALADLQGVVLAGRWIPAAELAERQEVALREIWLE